MKSILAILLLISVNASAVEVLATGSGKNYNSALANAKVAALDKANGSWIHGETNYRDGEFSESITEYNGGVVASYEVLDWNGTTIRIKADVVPREKNGMSTNSLSVPSKMRSELDGRRYNEEQKAKASKVLDNRSSAIKFTPEDVSYKTVGDQTHVTVTGIVGYQDKWVSDYKDLVKMAGKVELSTFRSPLVATLQGMDGNRIATKQTFRLGEDRVKLYNFMPTGIVPDTEYTSRITLTFIADSGIIKSVDKFVITF